MLHLPHVLYHCTHALWNTHQRDMDAPSVLLNKKWRRGLIALVICAHWRSYEGILSYVHPYDCVYAR